MAKIYFRNEKEAKKLSAGELSELIAIFKHWPENEKKHMRSLMKHIWYLQGELDRTEAEITKTRQKDIFDKLSSVQDPPKLQVKEQKIYMSFEERAYEHLKNFFTDPKPVESFFRHSQRKPQEIVQMAKSWAQKNNLPFTAAKDIEQMIEGT